jgi:serine/threonine protein kinase
MKLLRHPNVIRLYEVVDTEKVLFLIMEYASGGEVLDFIVAHGRLGEKEARRFFRQILSAIAYGSFNYSERRVPTSAAGIATKFMSCIGTSSARTCY